MTRIDCPDCKGTGWPNFKDTVNKKCPECHGAGTVEPQPDHTLGCIKHKAIFGSVGCTCKPDQSSRLLTDDELELIYNRAISTYIILHPKSCNTYEREHSAYRAIRDAQLAKDEARREALIEDLKALTKDKIVIRYLDKIKANPTSEVEG